MSEFLMSIVYNSYANNVSTAKVPNCLSLTVVFAGKISAIL